MNDIGVAVIGSGFIGPVHVEALRRLGINVTGILGSSPNASSQAAKQLGLSRAYSSLDEVLSDSTVDSVHLAVPNVLHYDYAKRVLNAGKHVMCEKPLAMNSAETTELVKLANSSELQAGVCYNIRFYPVNLETRDRIEQGQLGDVLAINGSYAQDWLLYDTDYNWRVLADKGGHLRAVADIGTHWMDLVTSITGLKVKSVFADLATVHPVRHRPLGEIKTFTASSDEVVETEPVEITTDDYGSILFRFEGGAKGSLWVSQVTAGRKNCLRYEIAGSQNAVAWNSELPNELFVGHRDEPNGAMSRNPGLMGELASRFSSYPGGHNEGFPDTFKQCFRAFYEAVRAGATDDVLYPTFEQGHSEVVLCEAILKSNEEERWITLEN